MVNPPLAGFMFAPTQWSGQFGLARPRGVLKDYVRPSLGSIVTIRPMSHLQFIAQFCRATLSRDKIVWHGVQLCRINKNWPISVHRIFATKLHRIERCSNRKRSCATVEKLRDTPCHTCDFLSRRAVWHGSKGTCGSVIRYSQEGATKCALLSHPTEWYLTLTVGLSCCRKLN